LFLLEVIAWASLGVEVASAIVIAFDEVRHPQQMWIMERCVAGDGAVLECRWAVVHFRVGRKMTREAAGAMNMAAHPSSLRAKEANEEPTFSQVAVSASHCGAGCVIGDIIAEHFVFFSGMTILGLALYASYVVNFILERMFGIAFQYFVIKPMRQPGQTPIVCPYFTLAVTRRLRTDVSFVAALVIGTLHVSKN